MTNKPLSKRAKSSKFIQIASDGSSLHALDNNGRVWRYYPATTLPDGTVRFAFWGSITTHRAPVAKDKP